MNLTKKCFNKDLLIKDKTLTRSVVYKDRGAQRIYKKRTQSKVGFLTILE